MPIRIVFASALVLADAEPEAAVLVDPQAARLIAIPAVRSDFQIFVFMFSFLS